jgi:hypothetical protein
MISDFARAAVALARAVLEAGGNENDLEQVEIVMPAELYDKVDEMAACENDLPYRGPSSPDDAWLRISGIKFARSRG